MRATQLHAPGDIRLDEVPDPTIVDPTDVVVRVTHTCICGSDLWPYRGIAARDGVVRIGHEYVGVVEEVGSAVTNLKVGDRVVAPFAFGDGSCDYCAEGLWTSCRNGGFWGSDGIDGGQGERIRAPFADANLVRIPDDVGDDKMAAVLALSDVMGTGHHAALAAGVKPGHTVVVVGDGAVGLCGVLAAHRLGASRIIAMSRHESRQKVARGFGATDIVAERGKEATERVRDLTDGVMAHAVLECVGTGEAMTTAFKVARDGATVGYVGVPAQVEPIDVRQLFGRNVGLRGGVAPVRAYIPELMADVATGRIDPAPVFDLELPLAEVAEGYKAMDERRAIKVLLRP
jgi:threonine dehydrogenase-like Zn-dependent dehydrogenase